MKNILVRKAPLWQKIASFLTEVLTMSVTLDVPTNCETYDEIRDLDLDARTTKPNSLEVLDWIPIVSIVSGVARAIFGLFQTIVGVFAFPFQLIARGASHVKKPFILVQGIANMIRGSFAVKPFIGNAILYIYDHTAMFKGDLQRSAGIRM